MYKEAVKLVSDVIATSWSKYPALSSYNPVIADITEARALHNRLPAMTIFVDWVEEDEEDSILVTARKNTITLTEWAGRGSLGYVSKRLTDWANSEDAGFPRVKTALTEDQQSALLNKHRGIVCGLPRLWQSDTAVIANSFDKEKHRAVLVSPNHYANQREQATLRIRRELSDLQDTDQTNYEGRNLSNGKILLPPGCISLYPFHELSTLR